MVKISVSCVKENANDVREALREQGFKHIIERQIGNIVVIKGEISDEALEKFKGFCPNVRISILS